MTFPLRLLFAIVERTDILGPSQGFRKIMDYHSHSRNTRSMLGRLAETKPTTLECMHGSAWQGDGARMLTALASALEE